MTTTEILTGIKTWVLNKLSLKQDVINDLASIRSGSQAGSTAVQPSDLSSYFNNASYDTSTHRINFYHGQNIVAYVDASPFIVDGMVDDVRIENGYLVIDFNTDSGKQDISIPLTDIFAPNNYYNKTQTDGLLAQKQDVIQDLANIRSGASAGATAVQPSTLNNVVKNTVAESGVYDVSANNDNTKFESLSALLSSANLNTLIPTDIRKGGMSMKFVQSSDNKYVQYLYHGTSTAAADFTNTVNWEKINLEEDLNRLESKFDTVEKVESENLEKVIIVEDDNEQEIVRITEDGLSAKSLKVGDKEVALKDETASFELEEAETAEEEQIWSNDDKSEIYAKINKNGLFAKRFSDIDGNEFVGITETDKICNTQYNNAAISSFIKKYIAKDVDEFNQITIIMSGDSIFGRQYLREGEMTPTKDVNTPGSTVIGYETGHFPPNMWVQNVPFAVLKSLQYNCADVKYFNHVASEVTKTGSWTDMYPNGADCLRTIKTNTINDNISLHFSAAKFAKVVISSYGQTSANANVAVTISENGGTFVTPSQLGLTESHAYTNSGEYDLSDFAKMKFSQLVFGGFDESKTYDIKVTLVNNQYLNVWGFETWTRERINVVVSAEGGNTALSQINNPQRFYNDVLKPELCIMNVPFLNDCGTPKWEQWYKGKKSPNSDAIVSPVQYDFIYCEENGTYTNFDNIIAGTGDYIEYDGSKWRLGSTKIQSMLSTYQTELNSLMKMLKCIGVPMLMLATHNSRVFIGKPFITTAADFMKLNIKESGLASIDVFQYQHDSSYPEIWSDGTHLNDEGVEMYSKLIALVLNKDTEYVADGRNVVEYGSFLGQSNGGNTSFGFIMKDIPKVFLSNPSVSITSVSKEGFTVNGVGAYNYIVKL